MGLQEITEYEKYLGLPSLVGMRKKESFNFIKEKNLEEAARLGREIVVLSK